MKPTRLKFNRARRRRLPDADYAAHDLNAAKLILSVIASVIAKHDAPSTSQKWPRIESIRPGNSPELRKAQWAAVNKAQNEG